MPAPFSCALLTFVEAGAPVRRWIDVGGKVWFDLQYKLMHLGQHNFRDDLAESPWLQNRW